MSVFFLSFFPCVFLIFFLLIFDDSECYFFHNSVDVSLQGAHSWLSTVVLD